MKVSDILNRSVDSQKFPTVTAPAVEKREEKDHALFQMS